MKIRFTLAVLALVLATRTLLAQDLVDVTLDPNNPGAAVSGNFLGLSYEIAQLLPDAKGAHYFSPENHALIAEFQTLGVRSLRLGGSSVDDKLIAIPSNSDIDALFNFAKPAGVKVIYAVRLKNGDPQADAAIVKYIQSRYADSIEAFAIGNEPSGSYETYRGQWKPIADAILAAAPDARLSGPGINPKPAWTKQFVDDFADTDPVVLLTNHLYPFGCSYKNPIAHTAYPSANYDRLIPKDTAIARDNMLASSVPYGQTLRGITDAIGTRNLPFRLEESNSLWFGGLKGASDTFASALWGLDYEYWWASHGAAGINFHTGDMVGGPIPCQYAAFLTAPLGYATHPLGYGMKAFDLAGHGRWIPLTVADPNKLNLTAYATLGKDQTLSVTIINKRHGAAAQAASAHLRLPSPDHFLSAKSMMLSAPNGDVAAKTGVTLGGAPIGEDGTWNGVWTPSRASSDGITVSLPPASAIVIQSQIR